MTTLGKTLVFLNLIIGIGAGIVSTSMYTHRLPYFEDFKDIPIEKGNNPHTFKQLATDIEEQTKAAYLASGNWGTSLKALSAAENIRATRYLQMFGKMLDGNRPTPNTKGLIDHAHEGNYPGANGGGFLNLVEDPTTKLLNLKPDLTDAASFKRNVVHGPDDQPLKGTDTLLDQFTKDSAESETQAFLSKKLRAEQRALGTQIVIVQNQIHKQRDIRDQLVVEATHLASFEVNATLNRDTFTRRRQQLIDRLATFQTMDKK
jgi:hypothetical protein